MATASESARSRDAAEPQATTVFARAALIVALLYLSGNEDEGDDDDRINPLLIAATALAIHLIRSIPARFGTTVPEDMPGPSEREQAAALAPDIVRQALRQAREHLATVEERVRRSNPAATKREVADAFTADTAWQRAAARTATTRLAAETALSMVDDVDKTAGVAHRVMWISRGDSKVRDMHRKLHGKIRKPGSAFKVWPGGQRLAFPGDPRAPLDATINCRCSLLLVPEAQAWKALDVFKVSDEDFLAASAARAELSQAELDLTEEFTRIG